MTFEELKPYYERKIKVTFEDNTSLKGVYDWYNSELDNEPDPPSIDLKAEDGNMYEIFLHEIAKVELIK